MHIPLLHPHTSVVVRTKHNPRGCGVGARFADFDVDGSFADGASIVLIVRYDVTLALDCVACGFELLCNVVGRAVIGCLLVMIALLSMVLMSTIPVVPVAGTPIARIATGAFTEPAIPSKVNAFLQNSPDKAMSILASR